VLFAITGARLAWLALDRTDLYPDEAQYWFWAQTPDWGYFSKPPLVAWIIALTTGLLGDSAPAVRIAAPLLHFGAGLLVYRSARLLYDPRTAFWSAVVYETLPGVFFSAAIMSTDAPLLLFWSAALYAFLRARAEGDRKWWFMVGAAIGFGLLAKFAMAYWLLSALIFLVLFRGERRHLPYLVGAAALALLIYSPNLWWNYAHGFASYHATASNAGLRGPLFHPDHLRDFFLAQFGVFGPLLFGTLIAVFTLALARRTFEDRRAALLGCFILPILLPILALSLISHAEPNWAAPAYVAASILVTAWLLPRGREILIHASVALHVAAAILIGIGVRNIAHAVGIDLPARYDPLHRLQGWRRLGMAVATLLRQNPGVILMADDRELMAALLFYVAPHPTRFLKWNGEGGVSDQFDLTANPGLYIGDDFLLVAHNPANIQRIFSRFIEVGPPQTITIFIGPSGATRKPDDVRRYEVYLLKGFKGYR